MGLFERDSEACLLREFLIDSDTHHRLLVFEGPAGIGKSRLLQEAHALAEPEGMTVLNARCSELEEGFVYGVVRQLWEPAVSGTPEKRAALFAGAARAASPLLLSADPSIEDGGADAASFATLHGLYWLLLNTAAINPVLITIDDVQWCDTSSLRWLSYLLPRLEGLSVRLVLTLRPEQNAANDLLIAHVMTDQLTRVVHPSPLTGEATAGLLSEELTQEVDARFAAACHAETAGNPLLLRQLINTLTSERVAPTRANVGLLPRLGASAVASMVKLRISRLSPNAAHLAQAVAVLGDGSDLRHVASFADMPYEAGSSAASELMKANIIQPTEPLRFVHPVVRASLYAQLGMSGQYAGHERAARLLAEANSKPERIAAHLLRIPPVGETWVVRVLRQAADHALGRGAADTATEYLSRCLMEPMEDADRREVLLKAGFASQQIDFSRAAVYLTEALHLTKEPIQRAHIAVMLNQVLLFLMRGSEAEVILSDAMEHLSENDSDLERKMLTGLVMAPLTDLSLQHITARIPPMQKLEPSDSVGGRSLDAVLSFHGMLVGDTVAVERARRGVEDGLLVREANGEIPLLTAWLVLISSGATDLAMKSIDEAIRQAQLHGSMTALAHDYAWRAWNWVACGQLSEAVTDAKEALDLMTITGVDIFRPFAASRLAEALIEQGLLDEAEKVLRECKMPTPESESGALGWLLESQSRLLRVRGQYERALATCRACEQRFVPHGLNTSALVPWRSEVALSLYALERTAEAEEAATRDLELARRWGAFKYLGRALRVAGVITQGAKGLELLHEAVNVLEGTSAQLELAKALADLGVELRRARQHQAARPPLRRALDLATHCGATFLAEHARSELAVAGGRPRRTALSGIAALTPSERRIAGMAAQGATNREIAQTLYVTPKTVEVHLSNTYRKLGITARTQLSPELADLV